MVVVSSFVEVVVAGNGDTYLGRGCRGCRRSSVVGVGRMLSMSKERGAFQGEHVFLGVVCCRSLASHGANKSTMRRPGNRAHAPGPTVATKSFNSKLGNLAVRIHHQFHQHGTKGFLFYSSSPVKHRSYKPSRSSYSEKRSHDTKPPALELFSLPTRMKGFEAERCIKTYSCSHHSPPSHRLLPARCTTCRL